MPQSATPHLHPIAAYRAMCRLLRNREDTRQVFVLMEALRGKTTLRQLARFRNTEAGRAMLAERRSLLAVLSDRTRLAALPPDSLGRAYYEFMNSENLSAQGLVEASMIDRVPTSDEASWFRERNREMHDLLHVAAGYGRDPLGEVCLTAFSFAQTRLKGFAVIAAVGALRAARRLRGEPVLRAVWEAYRQGRRAAWLVGADWENLLAEPLEAVRARFRLAPPIYYPRILPAMQRAAAGAPSAAAQGKPAAAA
jgi:ubiquinone biosynthesis protein COQ4